MSEDRNGHVELDPEEARAAEKSGRVRFILAASTAGAILAVAIVWIAVV